jgi:hypothetical protein
MKRIICIILWIWLAILLLTGCTSVPIAPGPALAQCNSTCYVSCVKKNGDTEIVWEVTGTKSEDWDFLAGSVVIDLVSKLRQCDTNRKACTQCLNRLESEGVIKQ